MSLLRYEENAKVQSLARPVFDSVTDLMSIHLEEGGKTGSYWRGGGKVWATLKTIYFEESADDDTIFSKKRFTEGFGTCETHVQVRIEWKDIHIISKVGSNKIWQTWGNPLYPNSPFGWIVFFS